MYMKTEIKSLADELRKSIGNQEVSPSNKDPVRAVSEESGKPAEIAAKRESKEKHLEIISRIREFDVSDHKQLLHPRLDRRTILLLNRLKLASGLEMNRVVAFAISYFFEQHPEIKSFVKRSLENFE